MARRGRKPKRRIRWDANKDILRSIISLFLIVIGGISLLSVFGGLSNSSGMLNVRLHRILVDLFGLLSFFVPFLSFYAGLLSIGTIKAKVLNYRVFSGIFLLFVSLLGVFGGAGGIAGEFVQIKTAALVSTPGAIFLYFVLAIFAIVLTTNTGLHVLVGQIGKTPNRIKNKFLGLEMEDEDYDIEGEEIDGDILTEKKRSKRTEPLLETAEVEVIEKDEISDQDVSGEDKKNGKKEFQIIRPPTGPVDVSNASKTSDNVEADEKENSEQLELNVDIDSSAGASKERKSLSRLPFTNKVWEYPPLDIMSSMPNQEADAGDVEERAELIEETLKAFGVKAKIADVHVGPAFTRYALSPAIGTKTSRIQNLSTDLALRMKSPSGSVRVEAPIPGTNLIGIEVPNFSPSIVGLRSIMESDLMKKAKGKLTVALGHDVSGRPVIQDISKWPHCLVAGATGSGKSVTLNSMISTLLFRCSPQECRFIMIDPKLVELSLYNGIPHLLTPVVTDIERKAVSAFAWAVAEMERRYKLFANAGVRNLFAYNELSGFQAEPYIVIVVDELADMMMVAASEVEKYIIRLAQKSRATGIHLVLATQRPSVNILTGTIKANIPTRFAFKVTSQVDSRVIIDQVGAETLIGRGDMLFVPPNDSKPRRIQGAFISDAEIRKLVEFLKNSGVEPDYRQDVFEHKVMTNKAEGKIEGADEKIVEALEIIISTERASASYLQRKLGIGYSRAARIIDDLEDAGVIGQGRGSKPREVLVASVDEAIAKISSETSSRGQDV